jgi:hypothetical protein
MAGKSNEEGTEYLSTTIEETKFLIASFSGPFGHGCCAYVIPRLLGTE